MVMDQVQDSLAPEYVLLRDDAAKLDGVIAIHSTARGPGAGGCRLWSYPSHAAMAQDAARLARGMTYKNAMADLPLGGAKAVLRKPEGEFDREALFEAFGRAVRDLEGRYVTAEDVGTTTQDMDIVATQTNHVAGRSPTGHSPGGDPSPWTARGVFVSMQRSAERHLGRPIGDCSVAVQGVGHVGEALVLMLRAAGARVTVADMRQNEAQRLARVTGSSVASPETVLAADVDIFAPCALGGILNSETIGQIRAKIVCGAANNQLETEEDDARLADRGILYAPDYIVNAGGIINVAAEYFGWTNDEVERRVDATADRMERVLDYGLKAGLSAGSAADAMARQLVAESACVSV